MSDFKRALLVLVVYSVLYEIYADDKQYLVKTKNGLVSGKEVKSIFKDEKFYSFLGIPYAKPPVGDLRFMPPVPHDDWTDILDAKKERKACAQYYLPIVNRPNYGFYGDEDCLHLSIHTPKISESGASKYPVMLFLLNEHFRMSQNVTKVYSPDFFMKEDVIIVKVNHRLGSLGFLSFNDDLLPGNNGLRDIILALTWIKNNIASFGGDPDRVTLMGSDGGSAAIDMLLNSPKSKGLFHRAILQSGTSWQSLYFPGRSGQHAVKLAETFDWSTTTSAGVLKFLKTVPVSELTENELRIVHADDSRAVQRSILSFSPEIEPDHPDAIITHLPEDGPIDIDIPIMIGYNSREGIEFNDRYLRKPQYLTFADRDFLVMFPIRTNYHIEINSKIYYEAIDEIKNFYFEDGYVKVAKPGEYITYTEDIFQKYAMDYTLRKYANESKAPVYYYTFDYSGDFNMRKKYILENAINFDGTWGASVGDDLCYLFVCQPIRKRYINALKEDISEEINVIKNMVKLWTNFAKTGNPTPPGSDLGVTWTPADPKNKQCLVISEDLEMKSNLHERRMQFWDDFIEKYKKLAVDGVVRDIKDEL